MSKKTRIDADERGLVKNIPAGGEVLIYVTDDGLAKVDVRLVNETLWLTQVDLVRKTDVTIAKNYLNTEKIKNSPGSSC